jgi:UDP-N-acetylglucosamine--N-acetylmuramyl-(pentapeptide) pyrophosphoryl-undecaprenol N-acetylglucosamine transferase
MEMEKVPAAGYEIIGLDIQGIQRKSIMEEPDVPHKTAGQRAQGRENHQRI